MLASDIDGTITDAKLHLHSEVISALQRLEAEGLPVTLATADALPVGYTLRSYLGLSGPLICENGGVIFHEGEMELHGDRNLVLQAAEMMKLQFPSLTETLTNRYRSAGVSFRRTMEYEPLLKFVKAHFPQLKLMDSKYAFHLIDKELTKGQGLRRVAELMKLDLKEVAAIGDSDVDVPMFEAAGFSIALGNASDMARAKASVTAELGFEDGFVWAVEKWILPQLGAESRKY